MGYVSYYIFLIAWLWKDLKLQDNWIDTPEKKGHGRYRPGLENADPVVAGRIIIRQKATLDRIDIIFNRVR